ncbi:MAG TPA: hypothetical protein VJT50_01430, partial [Pyrinomonadaceae bacterium]|nr:hypothetical protein [Pyrinomonadaceae bacterium]
MSKVQSPPPHVASHNDANATRTDPRLLTVTEDRFPDPAPEEFAVLSPFERFAFRLVRRMNRGNWKRFWTWCQKVFGAGWIHLSTYNLMKVYG